MRLVARVLAALLTLALVFAGLCQALLPALATHRLRSSLEAHGEGVRVSVSALPAFELLFDHADSVTVTVRRLFPGGHGNLVSLLERVGHAERLDAHVGSMITDGLQLTDVSLHKRGSRITASATVTRAAISGALPSQLNVSSPTEQQGGPSFTLGIRVFGKSLSVRALVQARMGKLVIGPSSAGLSFVHVTVFADPQVNLERVTVTNSGDHYTFKAQGSYT